LNKESYNFINNSFPKIDNNRVSIFNLKENNYKYAITSKDDNYHELIKNEPNLKIIHDSFFSKQFFDYFYQNLRNKFLMSRIHDLKFFIKLLKPKMLDPFSSNIKNFFFTHIKRQIEYSFIFNKGKIVPHTDSRFKLLSLLLFFPEGKDQESKIGTTFWDSNIKNLNNLHLKDKKDEDSFKKNHSVVAKLDFEKYHLYGFIRNEKSWHSVEPFDLGGNYVRKSININFYF
jgi:hypothetical protein